jgi:hypothetical protein
LFIDGGAKPADGGLKPADGGGVMLVDGAVTPVDPAVLDAARAYDEESGGEIAGDLGVNAFEPNVYPEAEAWAAPAGSRPGGVEPL